MTSKKLASKRTPVPKRDSASKRTLVPKRDSASKRTLVPKRDGWSNILTGIGITNRDKRLGSSFRPDELDRQALENIWLGDDLAARIIETLPSEMLREGYEIKIQTDTTDALDDDLDLEVDDYKADFGEAPYPRKPPGVIERNTDDAKQQAEKTHAFLEDLDTDARLHEALNYERAFGGAGILMGADDGQDMKMPLDLKRLKTVKWLTVLSAFELYPVSYYNNPQAAKYGEPEIYRIQPSAYVSSPNKATQNVMLAEVHASRFLIFPGIKTSRQQMLTNIAHGWGVSVLYRINRILSDFHLSWGSAAVLLQDFAQAVFRIKDLAELVATDRDDVVIKRAQLMDMMRSTVNGILLDTEEEFERKTTSLAGFHELLQQLSLRLAAAADMPVTLLMGQAPSGLNATGDSDIRFFYDRVRGKQKTQLKPRLERLLKIVFNAKQGPTRGLEPENWSLKFNPLWQTTDKEQADTRNVQANTDKIYIDAGVVSPEEIAASRFGGDEYSYDTVLDFERREEDEEAYEVALAEKEAQEELEREKAEALEKTQKVAAGKGVPSAS